MRLDKEFVENLKNLYSKRKYANIQNGLLEIT